MLFLKQIDFIIQLKDFSLTINKIIWVGCIDFSKATERSSALSPAANAWQINFIKALSNNSNSVYVFSHIPYSTWPKGPLIVKGSRSFTNKKNITLINLSYINIPLIRDIYIGFYTLIMVLMVLQKGTLLFTYNQSFKCILSGFIWRILKKKWILILADGRDVIGAYKTIYLSYYAYMQSKKRNKTHFDSGIHDYLKNSLDPIVNNILFAGSISTWTGIYDFANEFSKSKVCSDLVLDIYGKGDISPIQHLIDGKHIRYFGYVDFDVLFHAACSVSAFINPRPGNTEEELNNYPSKVSFYIGFGKKVISTKTLNISPKYNNIISYYESVDQIPEILKSNSEESRKEMYAFIMANSWHNKVQEFLKEL